MMKSFYFILVLIFCSNCGAQENIFPIKTDHTKVPKFSYLKDFNNHLDQYVGTWKANFEKKIIVLNISKEVKRLFNYRPNKIYKDVLIVKYEVISSDNKMILDENSKAEINEQGLKNTIHSFYPEIDGNKVFLYYAGTNCGVGWGNIYFYKVSSTEFAWEYLPNSTIITESSCPEDQDLTVHLPATSNLIFTKQ